MELGRILVLAGAVLVALGVIVMLGGGRLPGDINYHGRNFSFHFPIVTCLLLSVVLSLVMWFFNRK
jgi:hypothetical protein